MSYALDAVRKKSKYTAFQNSSGLSESEDSLEYFLPDGNILLKKKTNS